MFTEFVVRWGREVSLVAGKLNSSKQFALGSCYPDVYFNEREVWIMLALTFGHMPGEIAKIHNCTERTILFYIESMKKKLSCDTITQLIECVKETKLLEEIHFE